MVTVSKKDKRKNIPPELLAQWDKDRAKKAENKRLRGLARLNAAADPFVPKKGGKKALKALVAAARLDTATATQSNRNVDFVALERQMRSFVNNLGGAQTMALPPMDKND